MFWKRRRQSSPPKATNLGYHRWIRAYRPPLDWFFSLTEDEQEALALIGDEHRQDEIIATGYAVADPKLADDGIAAVEGDVDAESRLLERIAQKAAQGFSASPQAQPINQPSVAMPETFSGLGDRQEALSKQNRGPNRTPKLFGVATQKAEG